MRPVVPGSAVALADAVNELFGSAEARARLVRGASEVVQTRFSPTMMSAAYFAVYDELARKKSRSQCQEGY